MVSLLYRPPELFKGARTITKEMDMWSVGCVFAEMVAGIPVFYKENENETEQVLHRIETMKLDELIPSSKLDEEGRDLLAVSPILSFEIVCKGFIAICSATKENASTGSAAQDLL